MWVAPEARGHGVGEQLILAVKDWARSAGHARLLLDVADGNLPAVALYERMGFEPTGEIGSLPPPREHVAEHRRALDLSKD
jgi:ribosomal protein S18 acetylase RimI-like enzyme